MIDQVVEKLTERICFSLADNIPDEEFPAVISVIKSFIVDAQVKNKGWESLRRGYKRELTLHVSVLVEDVWRASLIKYFIKDVVVASRYHGISPDSFDMYRHIDHDNIAAYKSYGKLHCSQVYGIVMGCQGYSLFEVPHITEIEEKIDVLVISDSEDDTNVWQILTKAFPSLKVRRIVLQRYDIAQAMKTLASASYIVGSCSYLTYLACCMNKGVMEFYPRDLPRQWLSKWSNKLYRMIRKDKPFTAEDLALVPRSLNILWNQQSCQAAAEASRPVPM